MFLFSFLILPIFLVWYCFWFKKSRIVPSIFFGTICAVLLCIILTLFTFPHRIVPFDFKQNFIYLVLTQSVLPFLIPYALFCIFSRDSLEFKVESFLPFELSFYSVYLPYVCLKARATEGIYTAFHMFVKPVVYCAVILLCGLCVKKIYKCICSKKIILAILFFVLFVVLIFIPAVVEALYLIS